MKSLAWIIAAVLCNTGAQIALKAGAAPDIRWQHYLSPYPLIGLLLYGASFVFTVRIYADYPLSVISPLMAGAIFMLVSLASAIFFGEPVTTKKIAGIALIVAGIGLLSHSA